MTQTPDFAHGANQSDATMEDSPLLGRESDSNQASGRKRFRVGLLLANERIPAWQKRAIERMIARTNVEITHVVINDRVSSKSLEERLESCVERVQNYPLWSIVGGFRGFRGPPEYMEPRPIGSIPGMADAKRIHCQPRPARTFGNRLPARVEREVGPRTDVVVRFGFGVLKGELLTMPTHGVLSFHRGDFESYRGQPGGFWEFLNGEPTAGVTLQQLEERLDAGSIVAYEEVDIRDAHTWREVERRQIAACEELLAVGVRNLQDPDYEPVPPSSLGTLYTTPAGVDVLRYVSKDTRGWLRRTAAGEGTVVDAVRRSDF
ncbi:formyltransferase family protein [Halegenticoccus tardaugens]|uniref:formyltransferase family protein n=1 Tax=Halegenticoccus tardaugens TaxID=2071624 RepID=UPI00100BC95C|nr:formyltransferase family protein [Halegenticoccus tardaugens]